MIEEVGGGPRPGHRIKAVLPGVSNAVIPESLLDTPVSYEGLAAVGSGLGAGGFIVFDDRDDMVAAAAGVSRFLAVESCGQCTPCKLDGRSLADLLARLARSERHGAELAAIARRVSTVADRARCYLATQHQVVVASLMEQFRAEFDAHAAVASRGTDPYLVAELVDIEGDEAVVDEHHLHKQFDWSFNEEDSGKTPVDRFSDHRHPGVLDE
jgi:NADH:ubiquinone oxidoreductase subunit F (NADH-binding)